MRYERLSDDCLCICGTYPSKEVGEIIDAEMGDCNRITCMTADPPYGAISKEKWEIKNATKLYRDIALESKKELIKGGSLLVWGGIGKPGHRDFLHAILQMEDSELHMHNLITWRKKRAYGKKDDYLFTREELAWFILNEERPAVFNIPLLSEKRGYAGYNPKYPAKSEYLRRTNVWTDVTEMMRGKIHDAEKPVPLYEIIYSTHSNPGDTILDVCSGSGAAGRAAMNLGRKIILVEKESDIFDTMVTRLITPEYEAKVIDIDESVEGARGGGEASTHERTE
jgi:DNA modification methylase